MSVPAHELETYRHAWAQRRVEEERSNEELRVRALAAACEVATALRQAGATRVRVFGSVLRPGVFDAHSDLDMAVDGVPLCDFYRAYGLALGLTALPVPLDLVDAADLREPVRRSLEEEGVDV